ncbi:MAG: hypothetical protein ACRD26_00225 [Vicinamibacterales bacterium]
MQQTMIGAAAAALVLALPVWAAAQEAPAERAATVQDILSFLVTNQGVQTSDFDRDREAAEATRATLSRALLAAIATIPVGTSSSGFTYRLNPALGTVERASETFGPFFVERALTSGAGQANFGVTFGFASFTSLDGYDLGDGQFVTIANQFRDEPEPFDIETLALDVETRTATFYGNVGLSDRVDVGIAVPVVQLDIRGTRNNTYRGRMLLQTRARAETLGLADVAVRSKVRLTGDGPGVVAAAVEVRLPTGREENLLGSGETALRFQGLASAEAGPTSVHGNFTLGTGGLGREYSYSGAVAVAATPQVTIVGEVLARRIAGVQRISEVIAPHPRIAGVDTLRLIPSGEDQTTAFAVAGFKWNVGGTWLLHGNVLVPMTESGLTAKFTPTVALDYSFTR